MIALLLSLATAADVTWSFEAEATSDLASAYSGIIAPGDLLTGTITFDVPTDTGGTYQDVVLDAEFTLLGQTWTMLSTGSATVTNGATDHFATGWIFQGPSLTGAGGQTLTPTSINIAVFDSDGTVFDSRAFPSPPPSPSEFETNQFVVRFLDTVNGGQPDALFTITQWAEVDGPDACPTTPKTDPGECGCDYDDVAVAGGFACVHFDADVSPLATLALDVRVDAAAVVGASTLGANTVVAARAHIGDGSSIGAGSVIGRRASVEDDVTLGAGASIQRAAVVRNDSQVGSNFSLGYASAIGPFADIGDRVIVGSVAELDGVVTGNDVVVARSALFSGIVTLDDLVVVGPQVSMGDGTVVADRVRVRKDVSLGRRVTVGSNSRIGRSCVMLDDSGIGADVTLGANVNMGTFAHLQADVRAPRNETYPDHYDHDDDGALSLGMGGEDCDDYNALLVADCTVQIASFSGIRSWSDGSFAASCDSYRNPVGEPVYQGDTGSGQYRIDPDDDGTPFIAYCDMDSTVGWTLAATMGSGPSSSWIYDSPWWTVPGSAIDTNPTPGAAEARYEPFDASAYTAIRVLDPGTGREVHLSDAASSLVSRFATTAPPTLSDPGNGGHAQSGRSRVTITRYDAQAFPAGSLFNALDICTSSQTNDVTGWTVGQGIAINERGRYDASNGSVAQGRARIGAWFGGSNSHIWAQTADCVFGLGAQTQRDGSVSNIGSTMGSASLWVR